jgi:hypothetical protein
MINKWKATDKEDLELLDHAIANWHPTLVDIRQEIAIVFKDKAGKVGGKPNLGKCIKAPGILAVLGDKEYQFILEIGYDLWLALEDTDKLALIDHLLCHVQSEENEQNGEMTYSMRTPDVSYFSEEIERHGNWKKEIYDSLVEKEVAEEKEKKEKQAKKGKQTSLLDDEE